MVFLRVTGNFSGTVRKMRTCFSGIPVSCQKKKCLVTVKILKLLLRPSENYKYFVRLSDKKRIFSNCRVPELTNIFLNDILSYLNIAGPARRLCDEEPDPNGRHWSRAQHNRRCLRHSQHVQVPGKTAKASVSRCSGSG